MAGSQIWVLLKKSRALLGNRPPAWYAKSSAESKVLVFEDGIAPL